MANERDPVTGEKVLFLLLLPGKTLLLLSGLMALCALLPHVLSSARIREGLLFILYFYLFLIYSVRFLE